MNSESPPRSRYRRLPLLLLALLLTTAVMGSVLIRTIKQRLIAATGEGLALAAIEMADKIDVFLRERKSDTRQLAGIVLLRHEEPEILRQHLADLRESCPYYQWLTVTDGSGKVIASTEAELEGNDRSREAWFNAALESNGVRIVQFTPEDDPGGETILYLAEAARDPAGKITGVVAAKIGLRAVEPLLEQTVRSLKILSNSFTRLEWRILQSDGSILIDTRPETKGGANVPNSAQLSALAQRSGEFGWVEELDTQRSVPVVTGYAPTHGAGAGATLGWAVAVRTERADVLAAIHRVIWGVAGGGAAIVAALLMVLMWSLSRLRTDWSRVVASEAHLSTTLHSIAEGMIITDREGRITILNSVAENLTGWPESEARGKKFEEVVHAINPATRERTPPLAEFVLKEGKPIEPRERVLFLARDGTERLIRQTASPIPGERGKIAGVALVCRDVTDQDLAEAALRASQETFRIITDNMSDVITLQDTTGRLVFQSAKLRRGFPTVEAQFKADPFSHILEEDRATVRAQFAELISAGKPIRAEYRMRGEDGAIYVAESVGTLIRGPDGQPDKVLGVSRDITARRRVETRLRLEKELNDSLLASLPGVFFAFDSSYRMLRWNRNFEVVVGRAPDEVHELDLTAFFPLHEQNTVRDRMGRCFREGKADLETVLWHRNGRLIGHYISALRCELDGRPAVLCIGIDITARKAAEEALLATTERLDRQNHSLAELARNPSLRGDDVKVAFNTITEVSAQTLGVCRSSIWFYEHDDAEILCEDLYTHPSGKHTAGQILGEAEYPEYFAALKLGRVIPAHYARTDPRTKEFTETYLKPLGITSMLDSPIRLEGRMIGVICHEHTGSPREWTLDEQSFAGSMADLIALSLEVWQRRQAEQALREARDSLEVKVVERTRELMDANERLQELDRMKSEFLAMMSHELRTPLNSIIGFTAILRDGLAGPLNDEQRRQLGMVHFSARHLLGLINDLLDLSRIESGRMDIFLEKFEVAGVVGDVKASLVPAAAPKGLRLEADLDPPDLELYGDRKKTFQILLNLANNAVKFTDRGEVRISVRATPEFIRFDVTDTGIGIKPEQLANLFQAFRQVDGSARRVYEGTGLGLYLCKKLATLLGGSVDAESQFGVGSRFYFQLPRKPPTTE